MTAGPSYRHTDADLERVLRGRTDPTVRLLARDCLKYRRALRRIRVLVKQLHADALVPNEHDAPLREIDDLALHVLGAYEQR